MLLPLLALLLFVPFSLSSILPRQSTPPHSLCRFSPRYTQHDILTNSTAFVQDIFYWDGQFHQNNVGINTANGLTYDGCILNQTTGLANISERHDFSAASKEVFFLPIHHFHNY